MPNDGVKIRMRSGDVHVARGWASKIQEQVNEARGGGKLIALERCTIPTGQMFYLDPDEVESIRDDR